MKFFILLFLPLLLTAQNNEEFERIYTKTYLETSQKDFSKAVFIADSLYSISQNDIFKIKSLMLSATLFQQSSEYSKAVAYAIRAKEIAERVANPIQTTKINGFLATQYRILKLYSQSNLYLKTAVSEAEKISNTEVKETFLGMLMQENAYYQIDLKNYGKAIYYIKQSGKYFKKEHPNYNHFIGTNLQLLGDCYYQLNDFDRSLIHYKKALPYVEEHPNNHTKALVYNGIALCHIEKNNATEAEKYMTLAEKNSEKSEYLALQEEFYKTYEKYYKLKNKPKEVVAVKEKIDTITGIINHHRNLFINHEQKKLKSENIILTKEKNTSNYLIGIILFLFFLFTLIAYLYIKTIRQKIKRLQIDYHQFILNMNIPLKGKLFSNRETDINPETEKKILKRLEHFERSTLYNKNNMSLASLSIYCQTNTKYLSQVINSHKNKNFTNYINQLRIHYIITELQNNPSYRKYKIAALSEMTGFSSPSKFTEAFKKETNITAVLYIKNLEEKTKLYSSEE
ncbi:AraC family transcriptional regulator [Empedobacter brevis]|uniref:AraC family transcriptional regulator n=1 Tax=Empedobacter brevis TaxID=247 RepID=UPI00333FEE32